MGSTKFLFYTIFIVFVNVNHPVSIFLEVPTMFENLMIFLDEHGRRLVRGNPSIEILNKVFKNVCFFSG